MVAFKIKIFCLANRLFNVCHNRYIPSLCKCFSTSQPNTFGSTSDKRNSFITTMCFHNYSFNIYTPAKLS